MNFGTYLDQNVKKKYGETILRLRKFVYLTADERTSKSSNSQVTSVKSSCFDEEKWVMSLSYANSRGWYVLENTCK